MSMLQRFALLLISIVVVLIHGSTVEVLAQAGSTPIKTIAEMREIKNEDCNGQVAEFTATVTYLDPFWKMMFVQNGEDAIFVSGQVDDPITFGSSVLIRGTLAEGDLEGIVIAEKVTDLGIIKNSRTVGCRAGHDEIRAARRTLCIDRTGCRSGDVRTA